MPAAFRLPLGLAVAVASLALPAVANAKPLHDAHALPSQWKHHFHVRSASSDPDGDSLTNWTEFRAHTNPKRADSDRDGRDDAVEDFDRDSVDNVDEQRSGTDPARRDSDGDGRPDGAEDADRDGLPNAAEQRTGNDPSDPDSDGDGLKDGKENAGRVVAWDADTGELTLRLASTGKAVTGTVDDATDVTCDRPEDYGRGYDDEAGDDSGDDGSGDDGSGGDDSGDDDDVARASVVSSPRSDDDSGDDDESSDGSDDLSADDGSGDGSVTFDEACFNDVLAPGAWVHQAELTLDADGIIFDSIALVDDSVED